MTLTIKIFSITTFSIMTLSITTCSIMTFNITTFSRKGLYVTLTISDSQTLGITTLPSAILPSVTFLLLC